MENFAQWAGDHIVSLIIFLSIFIQISPIKWNPITAFVNWVTKDLNVKINNLSESIKSLSKDIDTNEEDRIRWEVLAFANSCRNNVLHTKEEFEHIFALNDKYEKLLAKTGKQNGFFTTEYKYIVDIYKERQIKNDFFKK